MDTDAYNNVLQQTLKHKHVFGVIAQVDQGMDGGSWSGAAGNLSVDDPYFIASTTKLFTTAMILRLQSEGALNLDDSIAAHLPRSQVAGIHVIKAKDYSASITVRQLLSQTSGLGDYFEQKRASGKSLLQQITTGEDRAWSFDDILQHNRSLPAAFVPGKKGKALYSDTNYQLLGRIVEVVSNKTFDQALNDYILSPLKLEHTYMYRDSDDTRPSPLYFKSQPLNIPQAMTSFGPDGGIVSTAKETMVFLKAFLNGSLFPKMSVEDFKPWNRIFFPLHYGLGVMRFKLPSILYGFRPFPECIGHSGLSGAIAYFCPEKNLYITGTVNQLADPGIAYRMLVGLLRAG